MFKTAAVLITFVFCAAGASTSKAQQITTHKPRLSDNAWHNHGWGFAAFALFPANAHGVTGRGECQTGMMQAFLADPMAPVDTSCVAGLIGPTTRIEDEKLGPVADELKDAVRETSQEALDRGKQVAQDVAGSVVDNTAR